MDNFIENPETLQKVMDMAKEKTAKAIEIAENLGLPKAYDLKVDVIDTI
jgi:hypothetical protein